MRILVVNKFWYRRAGLERVLFDEVRWLEREGHEVAHFSTAHPENDPSPYAPYFAPYLEIGPHSHLSRADKAVAAGRLFWNGSAARRFARLIEDFKPDVVHVHGIHRQVSPSILFAARKAGVPVVQTLHDYHPVCAAGDLLRGGSACCTPPACGSFNVLPCLRSRCVHGSLARSALGVAELLWRRHGCRYDSLVAAFITPSRYLGEVIRGGGWSSTPLHVVPNAIELPASAPPLAAEPVFLYAGRLSREKGLLTLLHAVELAGVSLTVAGSGPLADELNAHARPGVRFLGRVGGDEVDRLLAGCRAAILPAEWPENAPMAVLETMAVGRTIVATRMGGIPEQIVDGVSGLLVSPADAEDLAAVLGALAEEPDVATRIGQQARDHVGRRFSPTMHVRDLVQVYESVVR